MEWFKRLLQRLKTQETSEQLRARYGQLPSKELRRIVETVNSSSTAAEVARNLLHERQTSHASGATTPKTDRAFRKHVRMQLREKDARERKEFEDAFAVKESERHAKKAEDLRRALVEILRSETDAPSKKQAVNRILNRELADYATRGTVSACECGYPTGVTWPDGSHGPIYELTDCREEYGSISHYCLNCGKYAGSESL